MNRKHTSWAALCGAGAILALVAACSFDELLTVENPEEIPVGSLDDPRLLEVRLNGLIDAFQVGYTQPVIEWSNFMTDEVLTGLNWEGHARVSQRIVSYLEGPTQDEFEDLSRPLRIGHGLAEHIRGWAQDDPDTDFNPALARTLAFTGYSALVLGENMCQCVISTDPDEPSGTVLSQLETFQAAVPYFTEGLTVAQAVTSAAVRDTLLNLLRTGLARTYLGLGDWANAALYASQVTPGFELWFNFVDISGGRNPLEGASQGGNFTHGIHPWFTGVHPSFDGTGFSFTNDDVIAPQTDPRIQHAPTDETGHNRLTPLYKLVQGLRYGDYTGETQADSSAACPACTGTAFDDLPLIAEFSTDILMADYVEAQHHYHEALAMQDIAANEVAVLAFVNARRAVGNQAPVALSGQALIRELRNQRARDLFMGGFRLPDLRRWTRFDPGNGPFTGGSYFPVGQHPNAQWGDYGVWTCFPIPLSEYVGNQNLPPPVNPDVPPGL
ncbi:MAG: hypothetical protein ACREMN_03030 [Gemmatimonadales bacterium]